MTRRGRRGRVAPRVSAPLFLALASACGGEPPAAPVTAADSAIGWAEERARAGLAFLFAQQRPADGRITADAYAVLRRGDALTAAVLLAAASLPAAFRQPHEQAIARAFASFDVPPPPEAADDPVDYPCYARAFRLHALALLRPPGWRATADRLVGELRTWQLDEANGWQPDDPEFGGFGLGDARPQKPIGGPLVGLWTTTAVVEAMRTAGIDAGDPLLQRARRFAERCQETGRDGAPGGFAAAPPGIAWGAKAGTTAAGTPLAYGTATGDGLRALLATGNAADAPRIVAGRAWLAQHATAARCPGFADTAAFADGLLLYWLSTWSRTVAALGEHEPAGLRARLGELAAPDGSFRNPSGAMKEDDPVVATCLALLALAPWLPRTAAPR
jgi:hypothetical protein